MASARKQQIQKSHDDHMYDQCDEMMTEGDEYDFDPEDFEPLDKASGGGNACGPKKQNAKNVKNDKNNKAMCAAVFAKHTDPLKNDRDRANANKNCDRKGSGNAGRRKTNGNGQCNDNDNDNGNRKGKGNSKGNAKGKGNMDDDGNNLGCPKDSADGDEPKDDCDEIDSQNALCRRSDDNFSDCDCPQANPCKIDWKYSVGFQNFFCQYRKKFGGCQKPCKELLRSAKNHYRDLCAPDKQDYRCGGTAEPDPCRVPPGTPEQ